MYIILIILPILITIFVVRNHTIILPNNKFAIDKYYSFAKKEYLYKIYRPGKISFSISSKENLLYAKILNTSRHHKRLSIFPTKDYCCDGVMGDGCKYHIRFTIYMDLPKKQDEIKNLYDWIESKDKQLFDVDSGLKLKIDNRVQIILSNYTEFDLHTITSLEKIRNELFEGIIDENNNMFNIHISSAKFDYNYIPHKMRLSAKMDLEHLAEAGYNLQQINQILKANKDGIILSSIHPSVSEKIIRMIRDKYNKNKTAIKGYINDLSRLDITQQQIDIICDKIAAL